MAKDMSAVGSSASSSKTKSGLAGDEVFQSARMETADNGGYIINASYRLVRKGTPSGDYPSYCPDKQFVFESWDTAIAKMKELFKPKD